MDELAKANQRGVDLQYQLTDSENERMVLWDILAERKAKDLHAADLNGGKCAIHPDDCPVKQMANFGVCLAYSLDTCAASEYYRELAEIEIRKEVAEKLEAMQ